MAADLARVEHQRIASATRLTVLTGAGVSAASGVPTFRGSEGLWRALSSGGSGHAYEPSPTNPHTGLGMVQTGGGNGSRRANPNAAHEVLARWSQRPGFALVTQNVDGLHERAGTRNVIRYHGSIWRMQCSAGCEQGGMGRPHRAARVYRLGAVRAAPSRGLAWSGSVNPFHALQR